MTWEVLPPGTWLIFGIIGLPVYTMFMGWFLGEPRDIPTQLLGVAYFVGLITALWTSLFLTTAAIHVVFY